MNMWHKFQGWRKRPKSTVGEWIEALIVVLPLVFLIRTVVFGLYQVPTGSMETTLLVGERFVADKFTPYFKKPQRGDIIAFNDPLYNYSSNPAMKWFQHYVDWNVQNWTKRVIAIPGDHIQGVIEEGKPVVYLNGKKLEEPYLNKYPLLRIARNNQIIPKSYDPQKSLEDQPFYDINPLERSLGRRYCERTGRPYLLYPQTERRDEETGAQQDVFDVKLGDNQYWVMGDNRLGSWDSRAWGPLNGDLIHAKILFRIWSMDTDNSWWIFDIVLHPISFWKKVRWNRLFQFVK